MSDEPTKLDILQEKLKELFEFEDQDLDFGIYRIINIKRDEIRKFIDEELPEVIEEEIKTLQEQSSLKKELEKLEKKVEDSTGCSIDEAKLEYPELPIVEKYLEREKELRKAKKEQEVEEQIYDDMLNFFSRYYEKGDFISKLRYSKDDKYAIPYNGEEVYLHWANKDQYYIKTTEQFTNYRFKCGSLKVNFEIDNEDVDLEKNNVKGEDRYFIYSDAEYDQHKNELDVKFGYRPLTDEEKEKALEVYNEHFRTPSSELKSFQKAKEIMNGYNQVKISEKIGLFGLNELNERHRLMNGDLSEKTELEWHINKYTTKNTSDYFIHKNLEKFLKREMEFFIKNEMLHVDDIGKKEDLDININRIRVFKKISSKIIEFLAQIEDFQKKLWGKKKFVVSTDYLITLDHINETHYQKILENDDQIKEWNNLYSFDIEEEVKKLKGKITSAGSDEEDLKLQVLKNNPTMCLDTKFFDSDFKYELLSKFDNLDEQTNGILIKSENFQALNLLMNKYRERIKCSYVDPPFNTGGSEFIYKNLYKHSSWMSMIENRLLLSKMYLGKKGVQVISIDDYELENLGLLLDDIYGNERKLGLLVIEIKPSGRTNDFFLSTSHEYAYFYAKKPQEVDINFFELPKEKEKKYKHEDQVSKYKWRDFLRTGGYSTPEERPNSFYPIYYNEKTEEISTDPHPNWVKILPLDSKGKKRVWRKTIPSLKKHISKGDIKIEKNHKGKFKVRIKDRIKKGIRPKSIWVDSKYDAATYGTKLLKNIVPENNFDFPKSLFTVKNIISRVDESDAIILDYFAGSGTTGHAVIKLNKEDDGNRKFILVEMGEYFDTVLKPRIAKVIYSDNWKDGKPQDNNGSEKQIIKYQYLEQYEDTLNNLDFVSQNTITDETDDYKIKYMLEFESRESKVFLNLDELKNPFDYTMKIEENNEQMNKKIDLIETFNYIYGIDVETIYSKKNGDTKYVFVRGKKEDKNILIIWRNKTDGFSPEDDREFLDNEINEEYDEILMNGCPTLNGAESIDEIFKNKLMVR